MSRLARALGSTGQTGGLTLDNEDAATRRHSLAT